MKLDDLNIALETDAALRRRQTLQPIGGKGDKIFPPTYPGAVKGDAPRHVYERRRRNGQDSWCVLIDSVQSQANRLEECLRDAIRDGIEIPHVVVDFSGSGLTGITNITSLDAPHRIYDAILRDSLNGDQPFMSSEQGQAIAKARTEDASAVLELSPSALLFGAWHSTGDGGGLGAKFARCLTSEIVGIEVPVDEVVVNRRTGDTEFRTSGRRTGSRIDPLGVLRKVEVFKGEDGWSTTERGAGKKAKKVRPSEINHGNIVPTLTAAGVTCDYIEHTFVLGFAALRRLGFGGGARDQAGRVLLAALALLALTEQDSRGYALRSRCDLVCEGKDPIELVRSDGTTSEIQVDRNAARKLYVAALEAARGVGFTLQGKPLTLVPQPKLVEIVRKSQELALAGAGGDEDATADPT